MQCSSIYGAVPSDGPATDHDGSMQDGKMPPHTHTHKESAAHSAFICWRLSWFAPHHIDRTAGGLSSGARSPVRPLPSPPPSPRRSARGISAGQGDKRTAAGRPPVPVTNCEKKAASFRACTALHLIMHGNGSRRAGPPTFSSCSADTWNRS